MNIISAQVSLYPLRQEAPEAIIREVVNGLLQRGLNTRVGEMSTAIWGEEHRLFAALQEMFHQTARRGDTVMVITISNACPLHEES